MKHIIYNLAVSLSILSAGCSSGDIHTANAPGKKIAAACCNESEYATCSSSGTCNACKNCKYCKHCSKNGGTCSVCK